MTTKFFASLGILAVLIISGCVSDVYEYSNVSDVVKTDFWKIRRIVKDITDEAFLYKLNITKWHNITAVIIAYEYKDEWLVDDYSRTTRQFSEIFKKVFDFNSSIMIIGVGNYKEIEDEYGNYKDVLLAKSAMDRETYNKINWQNFNHNNLDKVTHFEFYGSSMLKGLRDLRDILKDFA